MNKNKMNSLSFFLQVSFFTFLEREIRWSHEVEQMILVNLQKEWHLTRIFHEAALSMK